MAFLFSLKLHGKNEISNKDNPNHQRPKSHLKPNNPTQRSLIYHEIVPSTCFGFPKSWLPHLQTDGHIGDYID